MRVFIFLLILCAAGITGRPLLHGAAEGTAQTRDTLVYKNGDRVHGSLLSSSDRVIVFKSERFGELRVAPRDAVVIPAEKPAAKPAEPPPPIATIGKETAAVVAAERAEIERVSLWDRFSTGVLTARLREFFGPWNGRFAFSTDVVSDTADRSATSLETQLRRKWTKDELKFTLRLDHAKTNDVRTADVVKTTGSWRHECSKSYFAHYQPIAEWNRASKRQGVSNDYLLLQQELGVGYHVITSATRKIRLGISQNRFDIWNSAPAADHDSRSVQSVFEEIELKLPWRIGVTQRGVWYPVPDQRDGWENRIEVNKKLTETLSTAFRYEIRRHNPDGSAQDYTRTKLMIALDF